MWSSLGRKIRRESSKEKKSQTDVSAPQSQSQQHSFLNSLKSITVGSFQKISKLSPYIQRKLHISSANPSSNYASTNSPLLPNSDPVKPSSTSLSADLNQSQEILHIEIEEAEEDAESNHEREFTMVEISLPWRRSLDDEAPLSITFHNSGDLEDVPRLDDSLSSHSPSSTAAVMRFVPTHHQHQHHHNFHHHHHHFQHLSHLHHHHSHPDHFMSLSAPMSSDSARGSSVASTGGDFQNASSSTPSNDHHLHADVVICAPWSRSNSHDLPTVQEEEIDESSNSVINKKCSINNAYCAQSQCEAETCKGSAFVCTDQQCNVNLIPQLHSVCSENDYQDIPKISSSSVAWCFDDFSSPPIPSDRCRRGEFIRDALDSGSAPHRSHPCFHGMHRDSLFDKTSTLKARYMSAHSMRCSDNQEQGYNLPIVAADNRVEDQPCSRPQAEARSSVKDEMSDVSESLESNQISRLEASCEERVLQWLITSKPYLYADCPVETDEEEDTHEVHNNSRIETKEEFDN